MQNIVFDMGNVLLDFQPRRFTSLYFPIEQEAALVLKALFYNPLWLRLDEGTLALPEFLETALPMLPEPLHVRASALFYHWHEHMEPIEPVSRLVRGLKKQGYHLYILSNAAPDFRLYVPRQLKVYPLFEGALVSAEEKLMKPNPEIFNLFCRKFHVPAGECVFIDDRRENVEGAAAAGMRGCVFTGDVNPLIQDLRRYGVHVDWNGENED